MGPHGRGTLLASGAVVAGWLALLTLGAPVEHVGAKTCGTCHEVAYAAWSSGPHADALMGLSERQADDPQCRACHTMVPERPEPELSGVQCEACHGAGGKYAPEHVMRDPVLARLLGLRDVTATTCARCHRPDAPSARTFRFTEAIHRVCIHRPAPRRGAAEPASDDASPGRTSP